MAQITKDRVIEILNRLISAASNLERAYQSDVLDIEVFEYEFTKLRLDTRAALAHIFGEQSRQQSTFSHIPTSTHFVTRARDRKLYFQRLTATLSSIRDEVRDYWDDQTPADLINAIKEAATASKASDSPVNYDRSKLLWNITTYFDMSEIENICFLMGVNHEAIRGEVITSKARELILYCERNQRIGELVEVCKKLRPNASWES